MTLEEWAELGERGGGGGHVVGWTNQRGEKPVAKLQPTTCVISQILTMRSLPHVTIRPLDGSMSMWAMLCFPSWNVANGVRSSSLMVSKQASHTRTGNSKPIIGNVERLELHFPHTALPHFLQWCCRSPRVLVSHICLMFQKKRLLTLLTRVAV